MKFATAVSLLTLLTTSRGCEIVDQILQHPCSSASLQEITNALAAANCSGTVDADIVNEACENSATPFGDITNMFYQHDKAFMEGGSIWNDAIVPDPSTEVGRKITVDQDRIRRVTTSAAANGPIQWPKYEALEPFYNNNFINPNQEPYMSEFNKTESCDLNTVMCCFTNKEDGADLDPATEALSKVCTHDLHDSRHSNHVNRGWAEYDQPAACVGFTFSDDPTHATNRYAGNSIFDISFRNKYDNKYVKNIPGAPLCGCIEKMPTVSDAKCRETTVQNESFKFSYSDTDSAFSVSDISASVTFTDCVNPLKPHAKANFETDLSKKLTDDCAQPQEEMRNEKFWISGTPEVDRYVKITEQWHRIVGQEMQYYPIMYESITRNDRSNYGIPRIEDELKLRNDIGADNANGCKEFIIRRFCNFCYKSHIDIYYKRFTCLPPATDFKLLDLLMNNWVSQNNTKGVDFNLYSTLDDAVTGTATVGGVADPNAWQYVNYRNQRDNYGFPFESGPTVKVYRQWNSFRRGTYNEGKSVGFYYLDPTV